MPEREIKFPGTPDFEYVPGARLVYTRHAEQRMFERSLSEDDVAAALSEAVTLELYPHDKPLPSRLVLGYSGGRALHVVVGTDGGDPVTHYVITVYEPDPREWEPGFTERRK